MQAELATFLQQYDANQVFVIRSVRSAYPMRFPTFELKDGEDAKSLSVAEKIWMWLTEQRATRKALLINIGGGTTCDLGGFVAATYLRGIDYINIPTTLLAMVDAAIGGKTGVNLGGLKNRVGAFYPPKLVITDSSFLQTLPTEEVLSGYGEIIKCALLESEERFSAALNSLERYIEEKADVDMDIIAAAREYKEHVVAQDPQERDWRKVLNFGHTAGHALEEKTRARHGYCVVWGMIVELYLSVIKLGCSKEPLTKLSQIMLTYYGRPNCNCKQSSELVDLMYKDKKNDCAQEINFTLLRNIGEPAINQTATVEEIREGIEYLFSL